MAKLGFLFQLQIAFSQPVARHAFALRCLPENSSRQEVLSAALHVLPECGFTSFEDAFGLKQTGMILRAHAGFCLQAEGVVQVNGERNEPAAPLWQLGPYRSFTRLTLPGSALDGLQEQLPQTDVPRAVMELLSERFTYQPCVTHSATTAEEAARQMRGVCQDEAHIMLALLRMRRIPCRYVMGYMLGEGASHAWVEVLQGAEWQGFDPTNNRRVNDEYIRIAAGRDADDCSINRGVFIGSAQQISQGCLSVWRTKE